MNYMTKKRWSGDKQDYEKTKRNCTQLRGHKQRFKGVDLKTWNQVEKTNLPPVLVRARFTQNSTLYLGMRPPRTPGWHKRRTRGKFATRK
jgi:hypothetical protein